jgi:hypothetical protein
MVENFKAIFLSDLAIFEMLLSNADLKDSLRENADKNRFFYCIFFQDKHSRYGRLSVIDMSG